MSTRILALLALLVLSCQGNESWEEPTTAPSAFDNLVSSFAAQHLGAPYSALPGDFDPCKTPSTPDDAVGYGSGADTSEACAPAAGDTSCEACAKASCCAPSLDCFMASTCTCLTACDSAGAAVCPAGSRAECGPPDVAYAVESLCLASRCATECAPGAR